MASISRPSAKQLDFGREHRAKLSLLSQLSILPYGLRLRRRHCGIGLVGGGHSLSHMLLHELNACSNGLFQVLLLLVHALQLYRKLDKLRAGIVNLRFHACQPCGEP